MTLVTSISKLLIETLAHLARLADHRHSRWLASRYLEACPDSMLKDIGIARSEIHHVTKFGRASSVSSGREGYGRVES